MIKQELLYRLRQRGFHDIIPISPLKTVIHSVETHIQAQQQQNLTQIETELKQIHQALEEINKRLDAKVKGWAS